MSGTLKRLVPVALAVLALSACANNGASGSTQSSGNPGNQAGPLKVGVILPLSGPSATSGHNILSGIEAEIAVVNGKGGVNGRQLEVISKDDESTPAKGVSVANQLVNEGVEVVMGGYNTPVTLAIQPILNQAGILNITSTPSGSQTLTGGADPDALKLNEGTAVAGYVAAKYINEQLKAQRIAVLLQNDAYGTGGLKQLQDSLAEVKGQSKIVSIQKFNYTDSDFRVVVTNAASAKPDVVFTFNASAESGMPVLMKQIQASSLSSAVKYASGGSLPPSTIKLAGTAAEGWETSEIYFPDAAPFTGYPANEEFITAYQKANNGDLPARYAALGAMSVQLFARGMGTATKVNKHTVAEAIKGHTFKDTIFGSVEITTGGQMMSQVLSVKVQDGKLEATGAAIAVPAAVWAR